MSEFSQHDDQGQKDLLSQPLIGSFQIDVEKAIYLVIILLALATRLYGIGDRVVSHDESLHTQYSYQYYNGEGYQHTPLMHGPSLFHATALSYWLFGDNDTSARIPVAIIGVILVILPYFLRGWIGKAGAVIASILLLISPYITYYSRYIRHDIYVITAAAIVFIAIQYYLRKRKDKYVWWFAAGMGLMFTTMETAYIYVAIFGSFLALSLLVKTAVAPWFRNSFLKIRLPLIITALALVLIAIGFAGQRFVPRVLGDPTPTIEASPDAGFAADPESDLDTVTEEVQETPFETLFRWLQIIGIMLFAGGLFWTANQLRPHIDDFAEFDLVILFTTLTLPTVTAFLVMLAGSDPLASALNTCQLAGQETMSPARLFIARLFDPSCQDAFISSGTLLSAFFLILTLVVSVLVGLWWNRRRWLVAAIIYHGIFLLLFTSLFTNPSGWASGMVGSLGYWLAQQDVQRANQPWYFYFIVLPLYEFLPLLLTLLAARLWAKKNRLSEILDYWIVVGLLALITYSLSAWYLNRSIVEGESINRLPAMVIGAFVLAIGVAVWFIFRQRRIQGKYASEGGWLSVINVNTIFGFVPYLIWWFLASWFIYSFAGEKMAWLSTHYILPMVLLGGWYINEKLITANMRELVSRRFVLLAGLVFLFILALSLSLAPMLLGRINLGSQEINSLSGAGRLLGSLIVAGILLYFIRKVGRPAEPGTRRRAWLLGVLVMLVLLTIRFTYMANFPNADYVTEYMVYAHGAPATKNEVLKQLDDLSMRLHGDKSIKVAFDNDSSWPFTWYLREYPNRIYFGENPGRNITEAPVVIVGSQNWGKVEPLVGDEYEERSYTFLWWPMEEYRNISWNAVLGDPNVESEFRRGLGNPQVRQALWDILFYRDYENYGQVFGGDYSPGQWPLRHDLRMYIRKDSLAALWDHGIDAIAAEPPVDLYAENEYQLLPTLVIGSVGSEEGQLLQPRNVAVTSDGLVFVADSGNHRIQVFDNQGQFIRGWGEFGSTPGQFNEPWGLAVDDEFVYVADTWNHRVQQFTHDGELVNVIGQSGSPSDGDLGGGLFFGPRAIVVLPDGNIMVTDTGNHRLQIIDRDGNFVEAIGSQGNIPGQFYEPVGLALDAEGNIFVADTWNGRVQEFNIDLLPANEWSVDAWLGESINNKPYVTSDNAGRIYITDPEGYRILIFDESGQYIGRFGQYGTEIDSFALPNGIASDADGNIYVADAGNSRVLVFTPDLDQLPPRLITE